MLISSLLPVSSAAAFRVAAAGDIGCPERFVDADPENAPVDGGVCRGPEVAARINQLSPDFTIALGDINQNRYATPGGYARFDLDWGDLKSEIRPTPGNHDRTEPGTGSWSFGDYYDYWEGRGAVAGVIGDRVRTWSSYDIGGWHLVQLNSNCDTVDCSLDGAQVRWLKNDLERARANPETRCLLAYMHHPRFSTGLPAGRSGDRMPVSNLWELLYRFRTDLVLTGHQHYYERYEPLDPDGNSDPSGIVQYISGTGGSSLFDPLGPEGRTAGRAVATVRSFGATVLELGASGYRSMFRTVDGENLDVLPEEVPCHEAGEGRDLRQPRNRRSALRVAQLEQLRSEIAGLTSRLARLQAETDRLLASIATTRNNPGAVRQLRAYLARKRARIKSTGSALALARRQYRALTAEPLFPPAG